MGADLHRCSTRDHLRVCPQPHQPVTCHAEIDFVTKFDFRGGIPPLAFNSLVRFKGLFEIGHVANTMTLINRYWRSLWEEVSSETGDERRQEVESATEKVVPMIWLLGKTAAGKSSIVKCVTGASEIAIGNGYRPCTRTADIFVYPPGQPLLKFLDTRGLGENRI